MIYCFMAGDVNLNDQMRSLLFWSARDMYLHGKGAVDVVSDDLVGRIETMSKVAVLGDIAGPAFTAEIDSVRGRGTVKYIIRERDLDNIDPDDLRWSSMPMPRDARWN